jgi:hypothetical protein
MINSIFTFAINFYQKSEMISINTMKFKTIKLFNKDLK